MYGLPQLFLALGLVLLRGISAEEGACVCALTVAFKMLGLTLRYACCMCMHAGPADEERLFGWKGETYRTEQVHRREDGPVLE